MTDTPQPLWDDSRIATLAEYAAATWDAANVGDLLRRLRDDYEAKLADYQAVYLYYLEQAEKDEARIAELEAALAEKRAMIAGRRPGMEKGTPGVREGLLIGRVRAKGVAEPSTKRPTFDAALQMATTDDLMWALNLLIRHPNAKRTWRNYRIQRIDKRLREMVALAGGAEPIDQEEPRPGGTVHEVERSS